MTVWPVTIEEMLRRVLAAYPNPVTNGRCIWCGDVRERAHANDCLYRLAKELT